MTKPRTEISCPIGTVGLKREEAAAFVRFSEKVFDRMVKEELMPEPHVYGKLLVWDRDELTEAFRNLPRRGKDGLPVEDAPAQTSEDDDEHVEFKL